jgi:integrase
MRSDWEPGELEEEKMQPGKSAVEARQRNKKRRLKRFGDQRTSETDQLSFLEKKWVQAATLMDYVDRVARFLLWASSLGLQVATIQLLDETAALYMNEEFFEGAPGTDASKLLAALGHQRQDLSRGATQLVRAHQAARGWRKLSPAKSRLPLPKLVLVLILNSMIRLGYVVAAHTTMLTFALYLRPSETLRILVRHLVAPVRTGRQKSKFWSIVLHPQERGCPSKTGAYDETIVLDNEEYPYLDRLLKKASVRHADSPLFDMTYCQWVREFSEAAQAAQLPFADDPVLYQLRHGGATHEAYRKTRELSAIQARGRWASLSGPRRYVKPGRVDQMLQLLSVKQRKTALGYEKILGALLQLS